MRLFTNSNLYMNKSSADDVFNPRSLLSHREYVMIQQQKFSMCWQQTIKLSRFNKINRIPLPKSNFQFRYFQVCDMFLQSKAYRQIEEYQKWRIHRTRHTIYWIYLWGKSCSSFKYTNRYLSVDLMVTLKLLGKKVLLPI